MHDPCFLRHFSLDLYSLDMKQYPSIHPNSGLLWAQLLLGENKATSMEEHLKVLFLIGVGGVSSNNPKTTRSS